VRLEEERKQFFLEKKNQKTFVYKAFALPQRLQQIGKSFSSFFKKKCFLACDGSVSRQPGIRRQELVKITLMRYLK
jgi:hypothetical protein